jgi:single-stranded DNA-binding protein
MSTPTASTQTLVGYLGKDRIERYTEARTYTVMVPDPILDNELVEQEVTRPSRPYLKLSLATHEGARGGATTSWHDLIVWSPDQGSAFHPAYLARKGDKVRVTGRFEEFQGKTQTGETICRRHFVVESLRFDRLKSPEIP